MDRIVPCRNDDGIADRTFRIDANTIDKDRGRREPYWCELCAMDRFAIAIGPRVFHFVNCLVTVLCFAWLHKKFRPLGSSEFRDPVIHLETERSIESLVEVHR